MRVSGYGQGKIDKSQSTHETDKAGGAKTTSKNKAKNASHGSDKVEVSSRAKEAAMAKAIASDAPDVNESKIEKLKESIRSGSYKVDGKAIADKMVDEHLTAAFN